MIYSFVNELGDILLLFIIIVVHVKGAVLATEFATIVSRVITFEHCVINHEETKEQDQQHRPYEIERVKFRELQL